MTIPTITKKITDSDFYYMIENQIRDVIPKYETGVLLPAAERILSLSGIKKEELKEYPIEGYYYKNNALRLYFTIIRNLQMNTSLFLKVRRDTEDFDLLLYMTNTPLFGKVRSYPVPGFEYAPLRRRYDLVTLAMEDKEFFDLNSARPWTIDTIMKACSRHSSGNPNLVEFAWLTGDPKCVCAGAETNALYRMIGMISGCLFSETIYEWCVSPKVEVFGRRLVDAYNKHFGCSMQTPTIFNHSWKKEPELPRVACLGEVLYTKENYFWILDLNGDLTEKYTTEFLTTEMFTNNDKKLD